jgi:hypothetical protein
MSSLQNKIQHYEVVPPASVWDKVAAALDESSLDKEFPTRLYNMELAPPAQAWDQISSSFPATEAPVIPMKRRAPAFIRYAVAAILISIIAAGVIKWTSSSTVTEGTGIAQSDTLKGNKRSGTINNDETAQPVPIKVAPEDNKAMLAEATAVKPRAHRIIHPASTANYDYEESYADQYTNPIYAYDNDIPKLADRYIMLMTPDGNLIRVSKKLGNLVCCVSGEEQDADCKSQIKKWQEKIATSQSTSPGNFLDILNLVGSLEDGGTEL